MKEQATKAREKLELFVQVIDKRNELEQRARSNPTGWLKPHDIAEKLAAVQEKARPLDAQLSQGAHEISELLEAVNVRDFCVQEPGHRVSRDAVHRGIGVYTRVEKGEMPMPAPRVTKADKKSEEIASSRPMPWWGTVLIAVFSGGGAGLATSFFGAFYGTKQTCIAGSEHACERRNGILYVQICNPDGGSYGRCEPIDDGGNPIAPGATGASPLAQP